MGSQLAACGFALAKGLRRRKRRAIHFTRSFCVLTFISRPAPWTQIAPRFSPGGRLRPDSFFAMTRPETVQDVLSLVRRSRLVEVEPLERFLDLLESTHMTGLPPHGVLSLMVERGLITTYHADELALGRWWGFWVGGYRILGRLGRGGMGTVFLAEHPLLSKRVAVKVLSGGLQADMGVRGRFLREARAAAALDHPNVVQIFHADVDHDPPFLVMEYVEGISLQAAVVHYGLFPPEEAAIVGMRVCHGLGAAAAVGLVHRDIKPANLLLDRRGEVKILDLGIARFTRDPDSRLVDADMILGTLDYLAPEQAQNSSAVDPRADMYALGATLYFLLAGHPPFTENDITRKLELKQFSDPTPLHEFRSYIPEGLSQVVQRLLARNPAHRFQTPAAAAAALEPWATPGPDYPTRLFLPLKSGTVEAQGDATDFGQDRDPTPLPITRRITKPKFHDAPTPIPPSPPVRDFPDQDSFIAGEAKVQSPVECGAQTVRLTRPPNPPTGFTLLHPRLRKRMRWLAAAAIRVLKRAVSWWRKR